MMMLAQYKIEMPDAKASVKSLPRAESICISQGNSDNKITHITNEEALMLSVVAEETQFRLPASL
jgi:hypothetical protein